MDTHTFTFRLSSSYFLFASLIGLLVISGPVFAQAEQKAALRQYPAGQLKQLTDLPPGQLQFSLIRLSPVARARALKWLQEIAFTGADLELLKVDTEGGVYFDDTLLPDAALQQQAVSAPATKAASAAVLADAFALHSRPGASNVVFIDFDGHVFTGTAWGSGTFSAVPYDLDGNRASFSDTERGRIVEIWHRVAEDLSPFNIDVTTEEPASFNATTGRILVTTDTDSTGKAMPSQGAGGVSYVNVFGGSNYASHYSPALVYYNNLGGGVETFVAEASAHEFGHNLGLSHDGLGGANPTSYYAGHGSGLVSWAPIMGNSYYNNVTEWSKGEYPDANQKQDDMAIIQAKLGLRPDDHGDAIDSGTALVVGANGSVVSSNPELDPNNVLPENKGVINSRTDVDVFTFATGAGPLNLTVTPAWDAFYRATSRRGADLDLKLELRNAAGSLVSSNDPASDTKASITATVGAGTYHLLISGEGAGNLTSGYSDYASTGEYFINGSVTSGAGDGTAPTPNPLTWANVPAAISASAISMKASVATDETSSVQYRFQCLAGGSGCSNSAWQSSTSYTANGLAANTSYTFNVIARDASGNQTSPAPSKNATTQATPPPPAQIVASGETRVAGTVAGSFTNTQSDGGPAQAVTEVESTGANAQRYTYLEHRWTFKLASSQSVTLYANAWSGGSSDGDTFNFQYSLNGGSSWTTAFNVSSTYSNNVQSFAIPGTQSGTILVRVIDTNRVAGKREKNRVSIDHLYLKPGA